MRVRDDIQAAIDDGTLPGASIEDGSGIAVGTVSGVAFSTPATLGELASIPSVAAVTGVDLMAQGPDQPTIYAASGKDLVTIDMPTDGTADGQRHRTHAQHGYRRLLEPGDHR